MSINSVIRDAKIIMNSIYRVEIYIEKDLHDQQFYSKISKEHKSMFFNYLVI